MSWAAVTNGLWVLAALTAVWSIARMNGTTRHCIRVAIVLIFVGCFGQALGGFTSQWDFWLDNILQAGLVLLLIFNVRFRRREAQ